MIQLQNIKLREHRPDAVWQGSRACSSPIQSANSSDEIRTAAMRLAITSTTALAAGVAYYVGFRPSSRFHHPALTLQTPPGWVDLLPDFLWAMAFACALGAVGLSRRWSAGLVLACGAAFEAGQAAFLPGTPALPDVAAYATGACLALALWPRQRQSAVKPDEHETHKKTLDLEPLIPAYP